MDLRKPHEFARGLILALVIPAFLAGCTSTPRTSFDWGVNTRVHHRAYVHRTYSAPRKDYAINDAVNYQYASVPVPSPRPEPGWYQDSSRRAPRVADDDSAAPDDADVKFVWPMKGHVISNFGAMDDGGRNDGINIAADYGEPVRAAADGTVSYAGNDLKSYGNLVLIRHGDGYVTAYAHSERLLVNRGDHVTKGQVIAYAGNTGDVHEPQLHFEIRRGTRPIDPRPLLRPQQLASREDF
jgi:murein DD-endopeptidase MepM/ murein hydrolase activator NlpD